jgi:diguanylate cyclase (GGDEF)-like protein
VSFFSAIVGYTQVTEVDSNQALERRAALLGAIEDVRRSGADFSVLDPRHIKGMERAVGLKDLRFVPESEFKLEGGNREAQSVLDRQGRIVGWFTWEPDRSMSDALGRLRPLLALTGLLLVGFAGVALWQVRSAVRELGKSEQRAWTLAHEDLLTGLPNHRKMMELIDSVLARRGESEVVTLAFVDLDGLKDVNDAQGHAMGDALLIAVASRLRDLMPVGAFAGRFDGDEFAILMTAPDLDTAGTHMQALASAIGRPYWINGEIVQIGVTSGLAHAPYDGRNRDELSRRADLALRAAKQKWRGGVLHFEPAMDVEFENRRFFERELKRALDDIDGGRAALDVHYQPIVSADGSRIIGAEALLRWTHPERGPIPPSRFVAAAERCGLMGQLGEFVLHRALEDAARWPDLSIAVNLSPVQVRDQRLVDAMAGMLAQHRIPASRLVLEVTEGVLIDDPEEAKKRLDALQALGVRLALDDFGTGYSSLTYLQRFKFDKLKIDKGFVEPLGRNADSLALVQAIVALGRALGMTLLAEGVETEEQRVLLRLAGCEEMQGYLFARPAPREALDRLVAAARTPNVRPAAVRSAVM